MSWDDFGTGFVDGFTAIPKWAYHKGEKIDKGADKVLDGANNLLDLFTGNSNVLIYIGIGIVAIAIVPTLIEKFM